MLPPGKGVEAADAEVRLRAGRDVGGDVALVVRDHAYGNPEQRITLKAGAAVTVRVPVRASHGWHDFSITGPGATPFERRFAGRVESGVDGFSDPLLSPA